MINCSCCNNEATHVLVDYYHNIVNYNAVFCRIHAFQDGRVECPCCDDYDIEYEGTDGKDHELLPTYSYGTLDSDGCCCDHP
ncbi:hypothetical protein GNP89_02655 [Aliivibrio fischeri]|uniref:hypothetical protein n=1 Tax=Aliivibrio fischeri TaxID=668 RepID=UPI0012D8E668|nr:hypothetical protein [Aliivibrio fischeri]MUL01113.1 hypothetical protein [Aliivibrio fischeri]